MKIIITIVDELKEDFAVEKTTTAILAQKI